MTKNCEVFLLFGTNDFSFERSCLSNNLLINKYRKAIVTIKNNNGKPILIKPPVKRNKILNEKINLFWLELEDSLSEIFPDLQINSPFWEEKMTSFHDGIHLTQNGRDFLAHFVRNFRYPSEKAQNYVEIRKPTVSLVKVVDQSTQTDSPSFSVKINPDPQKSKPAQINTATVYSNNKRKFPITNKRDIYHRSSKIFCIQ